MTADERRLLELLATTADGCTEALLAMHSFALDLVIDVVRDGLATAERKLTGGQEATMVRITDVGRRALSERRG